MRKTSAFEKAVPSLINACIVVLISLPVAYFYSWQAWRISAIALFLFYNLFFTIFNNGRCLGQMACKSYWLPPVTRAQLLVHDFLYTLSFATLFIWIWFPFDVFLANMLFLQLPTILLAGTTLHGYLSGGLVSGVRE